MAFSGALTLTDLNDFITPAQACIKPVEQTNKVIGDGQKDAGSASTEIHIDENGLYFEVQSSISNTTTTTISQTQEGKGQKLEQAQISLNDCLACSGCITSAESVLITLQSHTEVLSVLSSKEDERIPIISIAPQTLASLAAAYSTSTSTSTKEEQLTTKEVFARVKEFCYSVLGFAYVFDTTFAREVALKEHVQEFLERQKNHQQKQQREIMNTNTNTNVDSGLTSTTLEKEGKEKEEEVLPLPMLASACPGWICYAEKAHAEMLPFISRTKSPQQIMGTFVKRWIGNQLGKRPDEIYHVSVMPCYDKKLEASRQDFYDDVYKARDVDCVVTTGELELMMKELGWDLRTGQRNNVITSSSYDIPVRKSSAFTKNLPKIEIPELITHPGTSSGSYLYAIVEHLTRTSSVSLTLDVKAIRNADYEEYVLRETTPQDDQVTGKVVFKGVKCYGFRNLQNVVRKVGKERGVRVGAGAAGRLGSSVGGSGAGRGVRRLRAARKGQTGVGDGGGEVDDRKFDYVEVMACPGGCVNGGGQLKPPAVVGSVTASDIDAEGYQRDWDGEGVAPSVSSKWGDREWTKKVEEAYWRDKGVCADRQSLVVDRLALKMMEELDSGLLRTTYRAVESDVIGLAVKW